MTNTKQLTGAVALLASIAVLDNFIFIESVPGPEGMVLVELEGAALDTKSSGEDENRWQQGSAETHWIDQHRVSSSDFAKFLEATGREPEEVKLMSTSIVSRSQDGSFVRVVVDDSWNSQIAPADWSDANDQQGTAMNHILEGMDELKVSFPDALAYCNWIGKELPSAKQYEHILAKNQIEKVSNHLEFRCIKKI